MSSFDTDAAGLTIGNSKIKQESDKDMMIKKLMKEKKKLEISKIIRAKEMDAKAWKANCIVAQERVRTMKAELRAAQAELRAVQVLLDAKNEKNKLTEELLNAKRAEF